MDTARQAELVALFHKTRHAQRRLNSCMWFPFRMLRPAWNQPPRQGNLRAQARASRDINEDRLSRRPPIGS